MARPIKEGLSYFPLDVDSDYDDKFQLIEGLHGPNGFATIIKIYMKIYSSGYYYRWEEKEKILMAKRIGIESNSLNNIITDCVKYELFNEKLFDNYNILTSEGIQKRFFTAVGKRKVGVLIEEYLLMDAEEVVELCPKMTLKKVIQGKTNVIQGKTQVIQESSTQSKVKKTKGNESKVATTDGGDNLPEKFNALSSFEQLWAFPNFVQNEDLNHLINQNGDDLVTAAVKLAGSKDVKKGQALSFIESALREWADNNVKTVDQAREYQKNRNKQFKPKQNNWSNNKSNARSESLPDWAENPTTEKDAYDEELDNDMKERLARIRAKKEAVE